MGIFDTLFGESSKNNNSDLWIEINNFMDLEKAIDKSFKQKVAIFKHSTRCGISTRVKAKFEKEMEESKPKVILYYLDLLAHRDISNTIAEKFSITHQSPQLLVVENGKVIQHASHSNITSNLFS